MNNASRHSRQFFPLVLGNSRTALAANTPNSRDISTTPALGKEERDIKLDENPFYQKYATKIQKLKETNPKEYFERLEAIKKASEKQEVSEQRKSANEDTQTNPLPSSTTTAPSTDKPTKGLDSILKLDLVKDKLPSEITELWKSYYGDKDAVYAVIPSETYKELAQLRKANPIFIYPLPRENGYEMFLGQFTDNDCHFTSLVHYQKYQENAPVQLVISHFTELQDSKGIVLMSGTPADKGLSVTDAQLLSYQMQYFYNDENYQMVKDFNESPKHFDYNRIIECISSQLLEKNKVK